MLKKNIDITSSETLQTSTTTDHVATVSPTRIVKKEVKVVPDSSDTAKNMTFIEKIRAIRLNNLKRWQIIFLSVFAVLILFLSVAGVFAYQTYQVAMNIKQQTDILSAEARPTLDLLAQQNFPAMEQRLKEHREDVQAIELEFQKLSWYQAVPVANQYYADGKHGFAAAYAGLDAADKAVNALLPYSDLLGFGDAPEEAGGSAEDRIQVLLASLEKLNPELDAIEGDLQKITNELAAIDPNRYPEDFQGKPLRSYVTEAQTYSKLASTALSEYRPVINKLPQIAGAQGEKKKYLILFQNDNELRPTGGFLTAYAIIYVENGKVIPEKSDDIYELDKKFGKKLAIPEALGRYLTTEKYWNLRDMNISPDFKVSMDQFYGEYAQIKGEHTDVDGVIAVDTHFLTGLLEILGPVEVPGYGTFSTQTDKRCDCPQIIYALSEIITRPTNYIREDRKGVLGPLMRAILSKAYDAPRQMNQPLFEMVIASIKQRHVQMYFMDEEVQKSAEVINAAGRLPANVDGDFLAVVNANLGGAKSNLFVSYDMHQVIESAPENGELTKTIEITYKNSRKGDNCNLEAGLLCLNSTLRDWTRLYIPAGSKLVDAQGFTAAPQVYEESGFTVIDGFFMLEPMASAKLKLTYTIPYTDTEEYRIKLWKQGGLGEIPVLFDVTGGEEQVNFVEDMVYKTEF